MEATLLQLPQKKKKKKSKNKFKPDLPDEAPAALMVDQLLPPTEEQARRASGRLASTSNAQPEHARGSSLLDEGAASGAASRESNGRRTATRMKQLLHANGGGVRHGKQPTAAHQQAAGPGTGLIHAALEQQLLLHAKTAAPSQEQPIAAQAKANRPLQSGRGKASSTQQVQINSGHTIDAGLPSQAPEGQTSFVSNKRRKGNPGTAAKGKAAPHVQVEAADGTAQAAVALPTTVAEPLKGAHAAGSLLRA